MFCENDYSFLCFLSVLRTFPGIVLCLNLCQDLVHSRLLDRIQIFWQIFLRIIETAVHQNLIFIHHIVQRRDFRTHICAVKPKSHNLLRCCGSVCLCVLFLFICRFRRRKRRNFVVCRFPDLICPACVFRNRYNTICILRVICSFDPVYEQIRKGSVCIEQLQIFQAGVCFCALCTDRPAGTKRTVGSDLVVSNNVLFLITVQNSVLMIDLVVGGDIAAIIGQNIDQSGLLLTGDGGIAVNINIDQSSIWYFPLSSSLFLSIHASV